MNSWKIQLKDELNIYSVKEVELVSGLTIVTGCNGAGKSTLLSEINDICKDEGVTSVYLDCRDLFTQRDANYIPQKYTMSVLNARFRSEHEHYEDMFYDWVGGVRPPDRFRGKKFVILIDGLDSGGDVVNFASHVDLFNLIVDDASARGVKLYLLVTCNNFDYLCNSKKGRVLYCPTMQVKSLPAYKKEEYEEYSKDIRNTARVRGFLK